jgi:hypothetical protein
MAEKRTVTDLFVLRAKLVERRHKEAYRVEGVQHDERLYALAQVHLAILALDAVIEEGRDGPETDVSSMMA